MDWPSQTALGYRAVVADPTNANVWSKWIVVPRMSDFGPHLLGRDRARRVRQTLSRYEFRKLSDPVVLLDQDADPQLVIGAFNEDELVGFGMSYGVGTTVHFTDVCTTDEALRGKVSDGLYWCTLNT